MLTGSGKGERSGCSEGSVAMAVLLMMSMGLPVAEPAEAAFPETRVSS